jgi:hypothetical protein
VPQCAASGQQIKRLVLIVATAAAAAAAAVPKACLQILIADLVQAKSSTLGGGVHPAATTRQKAALLGAECTLLLQPGKPTEQ